MPKPSAASNSNSKPMFFSNSLENQLQRWNETIRNQPKNPNAYIRRGMVNFQLAKIDESIQDFDIAEQLDARIKPYLWQRGLSYYYAQTLLGDKLSAFSAKH